jgi:hypothetical protein
MLWREEGAKEEKSSREATRARCACAAPPASSFATRSKLCFVLVVGPVSFQPLPSLFALGLFGRALPYAPTDNWLHHPQRARQQSRPAIGHVQLRPRWQLAVRRELEFAASQQSGRHATDVAWRRVYRCPGPRWWHPFAIARGCRCPAFVRGSAEQQAVTSAPASIHQFARRCLAARRAVAGRCTRNHPPREVLLAMCVHGQLCHCRLAPTSAGPTAWRCAAHCELD